MPGVDPTGLDLEAWEREAIARTGLDDFGPGDWRGALERLLEAAEGEARLNEAGRAILRMLTIDRLTNRLQIEAWFQQNPAHLEERVEAPLILATLPRTGQTAAGWILDRDPANRSLLTWFAKRPVPPPAPGDMKDDPRIGFERARVRAMPREVLEMHLYDAEEPDECHWLLSNDMKIPHEIYSMHVPSYYRWVRDRAEMGESYRYFARQLAMLQLPQPPRRWILKNSPHLLFLDALHTVFPDAIYVQFHRDPLKVLASNCKLALMLRRMHSDHVDPTEVGASMLELLGDYVDRLLAFRASGQGRPWIDLSFREFVRDPVTAVEQIYARADLPLDDAARSGMQAWVEEHPRSDLTRARPADLSPYGLDEARAMERFAAYVDHFGVEFDGI